MATDEAWTCTLFSGSITSYVSNTGGMGSQSGDWNEAHTRPHWPIPIYCNGPYFHLNIQLAVPDLLSLYIQDTEFPGVVARPIGSFKTSSDYHYQTMRCNVDLLKIIQVGITLADEEGQFPQECSTWQFNFKFSLACVVQLPLDQKKNWLTLFFPFHESVKISTLQIQ